LLKASTQEYSLSVIRNVKCKRIECDEIWNFAYAKDKNLPEEMRGMPGVGSMWTWTAICSDSKLIVSWRLGARDSANAYAFTRDLAERLSGRVQLTTDGNRLYINAIDNAFQGNVDYAMLIKIYGNESEERTYSPQKCLGADKVHVDGNPEWEMISTSYAERQNLLYQDAKQKIYETHECLFKEGGNAGLQHCDHVRLSQLCPRPPDP
jgi:IS1 family transposase